MFTLHVPRWRPESSGVDMTVAPPRFMRVYDAQRLKTALRAIAPPLLFGFRLWASVCLALYVAFWLELDNAFWSGYTAVTVSQPRLGASLRKGWFRMVGTVVGAAGVVAACRRGLHKAAFDRFDLNCDTASLNSDGHKLG